MAFSSTTIQPVTKSAEATPLTHVPDAVLSMLLLTAYAAHKSKKNLGKLKRKLLFESLKLKISNLFNFKKSPRAMSTRSLILIIVVLLALLLLLTVSWQTAIILLLAGILLALLVRS